MKKKKNKKIIFLILAVLFAVVACVCVVFIVRDYHQRKVAASSMEELKVNAVKDSSNKIIESAKEQLKSYEIEIPEKDIDFDSLQKANSDIYAWVYVPGTEVDYPVFQREGEDSYYLMHNMDGSEGYPGVIYTQGSVNSKDFTDPNTVLCGHNMKDGSMFATLHRFEDKDFFDEHRYIYIYTPEKVFVYKIYAAYTYSDTHILKAIDISTKAAFQNYIDSIYALNGITDNFADDIKATADNHIISLMTCTSVDDQRYYVQGILLNED
jgi:sortase B